MWPDKKTYGQHSTSNPPVLAFVVVVIVIVFGAQRMWAKQWIRYTHALAFLLPKAMCTKFLCDAVFELSSK